MIAVYVEDIEPDETTVADLRAAGLLLFQSCVERTPSLEGEVTQLG